MSRSDEHVSSSSLVNLAGFTVVESGWIDPDTLSEDYVRHSYDSSPVGQGDYSLVFSDEFNVPNRDFINGHDPRWTAIHKDDYTNYALQYYNQDLVKTTEEGFLNISTIVQDVTFTVIDPASKAPYKKTKNYQSAMIQGWNKFCFTGGIVEISAQLPGDWDKGGLWPAMWLLGNLARATYVGSSNNMWPWSYDICNSDLQIQQLISACNKINHFDLHHHQGRGAPEIDILESMSGNEPDLINTNIHKPYYSASYQVAPGIESYRPEPATVPDFSQWYRDGLEYGPNTSLNVFFYGMHLTGATPERSYLTDAISANTNLYPTHFQRQHLYRLEWMPDDYLAWYLDGEFVFRVNASALNMTGAMLPHEPMYLILNTAMSYTWSFPMPCPDGCPCDCYDCRREECLCAVPPRMCEAFPTHFLIDYVRVYQNTENENQTVGCSTPKYPTRKFILGHQAMYMSVGDTEPLHPLKQGGGRCTSDNDCGVQGSCNKVRYTLWQRITGEADGNVEVKQCQCVNTNYTGPYCRAAVGYDDIQWDVDEEITVYWFLFPSSFLIFLIVFCIGFLAVVANKYHYDLQRKNRYFLLQNNNNSNSYQNHDDYGAEDGVELAGGGGGGGGGTGVGGFHSNNMNRSSREDLGAQQSLYTRSYQRQASPVNT